MDYAVVIATRNRPEALKLSIPLILRQSRKPQQLIIVDASDVHEQVRQTVIETIDGSFTDFVVLQAKANLPRQRNIGLKHVKSPVTIFPDDDSLWWPGVAEAIMRIYERDTNGDIGGVCGRETPNPPPGININAEAGYRMNKSDFIRQKISGIRHKFDYRFCPDPLWMHGRSRWCVRPIPEWLHEENAALVELMSGFRMSFRTEIIRECGFDEDTGNHIGYSAYGDIGPSFYVLKNRLLVGAHNAKIYHYRFPGPRTGGFEFGFFTQFNRAYIICKYSPAGSAARCALRRFALYKMVHYMLGIHSQYERERVKGVLLAMRFMKELLNAPLNQLRQCYVQLCQKAMLQRNNKK